MLLNVALGIVSSFALSSWIGWAAPDRLGYPSWLGDGLPFLQFMAVAFLVDRLVGVLTESLRGNDPARPGIPRLAVQLLSVVIYLTFLGISVGVVFHQSVSAVLAASGIVGLAVGFAVRGLLSDVFSGIALHLDTSFRPGDWLDLTLRGKQIFGQLVDIQWRSVVIADRELNRLFIPNSEFALATIINRSQPERHSEFNATLPISSLHDRARVFHVLENALARAISDGAILAAPAPYVRIAGLAENGALLYRLFYVVDLDAASQSRARNVVLCHAVDFLKAANIALPPVERHEQRPPTSPGEHRFTETSARLSVLADVPLLSVLSQAELAALADNSVVRFFSGGSQVMTAGEAGTSMVVVVEGRLAVMVAGIDGPHRVATLWPGECAGEMSLLTGSPRSANVVADGPTCLLEVPKAALTDILHANPLLVERIAAAIAKRTAGHGIGSHNQSPAAANDDEADTLIAKMRKFFRLMS
ncbi:MAG: cyclic nucleotide-binding domain-containing protein [Bacteroidales bacterium]